MFTKSSETEPLIEANNPFYNELANINQQRSKPRTYSYKTNLFFITLLIATGVLIYEVYPRNSGGSSPLPTHNYNFIQMEQTHQHAGHVPKSWNEKGECTDDHSFTLTLALKQQNTEALHEHVAEVSHPKNADTFHKYWTAEEVRSYFRPSTEALQAVREWLRENEFTEDNGKIHYVSKYGNVIKVSLTCGQANKLLNTQYMLYENSKNGKQHLRVKDGVYNIPDTVIQHIDFMSPTIRFPLERHTLKVHAMDKSQIDLIKSHTRDDFKKPYQFKLRAEDAEDGETEDDDDDGAEEGDSDSNITPNIPSALYALYDMESTFTEIIGDDVEDMESSTCRQAVASFIEQYYSDDDISLFWEDLDVYPESKMERVPESQPQGYGSEAELDTQYMTSTGKGIYTYVYYIDSDDIFVSLAEAILDTDTPPLVVSISYGADEYELGQDWVTRCNEEFGKLALIGTTVLASSGDSGIKGNDDDCLYGDAPSIFEEEEEREKARKGRNKNNDNNRRKLLKEQRDTRLSRGGNSKQRNAASAASSDDDYTFVASFPASAPYVTAVGGTTGGTVQDDVSDSTGEQAWLYSGGGFSIYFDQPEWQKDAVSNYFDNDNIDFPLESRYVATGRGYPDISAQSVDYVIAYDDAFYLVSGTSASSPTVAGMISMINYARIKQGKQSLGFLNPSLYALYDDKPEYYFNDVTEGYNIGCEVDDDIGFYAASGWDPITGVGTPKFSRIYEALLDLD